jgi:L-aminopeptidase/D-esterase-like protein
MMAADVRGGAVGQFMVEEHMYRKAICLVGGSLYGLEAATGVAAELLAQSDYSKDFWDIATVAGVCVYDFGFRGNSIYPDKDLGRAAIKAAQPGKFPMGQRGAGVLATVGKAGGGLKAERGGQGAAFLQVGEVKIAAFVVVNAMGAIHDRDGKVVRGNVDRSTNERSPISFEESAPVTANTTLSVIVTNQQLNRQEVQVGRQVHASMGRAIQPFHTGEDGDTLFTVTTNEVRDESMNVTKLASLASELMWDAVLASYEQES